MKLGMKGLWMTGVAVWVVAISQGFSAEAIPNKDCLDCHEDKTLTMTNAQGREISLFVDESLLKLSVHKTNTCVSCHADLTSKHPDDNVRAKTPVCAECHDSETQQYAASIHGMSRTLGGDAAASCGGCHGSHAMLPAKHPDSPVFKLNLPRTCASCHTNAGLTAEYNMKYPQVASQYIDSMHGRALLKMGLIVAPSCNDCHGVHDIKRSVDRTSPIHDTHVAATCGKCHVGVEPVYNASVHGRALAMGHTNAPTCNNCHTAHSIEDPTGSHFRKVTSDERCGQCHQDRLERYHETYHGKAIQLGKPSEAAEVAACYDCHGHHDVLPGSDPNSHLSKTNIVATCARCHPGATASFAQYDPHADHFDRKNYPAFYWTFMFMTALLIGVFTFFGAHTLLWMVRSLWLFLHDSRQFREAKISTQKGDEWFTRFTPYERFLHILVVTSFLLLTITGMPLKFYYTNWAQTLFNLMGGAEVARWLHHFGAMVTFTYFALHIAGVATKTWKRRADFCNPETGRLSFKAIKGHWLGPDSMIPTLQDWRDFIAHNRWFFGKGQKPQFDRWTYWEKFDYFAVFWGVFAIGLSGLVLWFPLFFSKFLPGWIINIALIVHSDEALLAAGFIFTVHFFNTHFRLEKFPMDTVIFSGRVSKTEMLHERKRWWERLVSAGKLDQFRVRDEWERWKAIARSFGYLFFGIGLILLVLILYAMVTRLAH
jgi:cytochrome b subunit of formate dehydrogenase